ncbi:DUF2946 domain-containing protein [Stenotrophomonas sp. ZAC14D1_NAIMI4_6]|uniref:DUF2946 family protein n=1 Tax=unclassified Stenotrophomonas maltophilia group TaxID=2961925 RepID=UPI000D541643|nr:MULTISPECIES: DUF2946 family protein [unclassified Stenotrophomonas maltophilia group]AWH36101.1 DUF2946 domain-containing protein [Stenotrophomonas sp. ZAC14D1_NAIMI4_6]AWH40292.1 DUF2946 domain-containing protein [Stenotrophomonas sp. ZAC14D1_NAIMI4_1]
MLLVLLAPLVSRWMAHGPAPAAAPVMAGMDHGAMDHSAMGHGAHAEHAQHAMEGHHDHHAMAMAHDEAAGKPAVDPHAEHEMGVDCEYCLIAARLITLLVAAFLLLVPLAPVCRALAGSVRALPSRLRGTLGARGPPVAFAG